MLDNTVSKPEYNSGGMPVIGAYDNEVLTHKARLFVTLVEKWGMSLGGDDGEDTAGRHQLKLMPVDDVIARAHEMAEKVSKLLHDEEGYIYTLPTLDEANDILVARDFEKEAKRQKKNHEMAGLEEA